MRLKTVFLSGKHGTGKATFHLGLLGGVWSHKALFGAEIEDIGIQNTYSYEVNDE
jgi:hypothetical protein